MNTSLLDEILFRRLGQSVHTRIRSALLKTGQVTQYGGYPDDGYYQKGIAKRYEVLTLGQYSGTTNIVLNGKTDVHSNNCVLDLNTGLMWSRYGSDGVGPNSNGALPWTTNAEGEGVFPYMDIANIAGLSGYSDWRVPNFREVEQLCSNEGVPILDPVAFPVVPTTGLVSSSTRRATPTQIMTVGLTVTLAIVTTQLKTSVTSKVLLVRGG